MSEITPERLKQIHRRMMWDNVLDWLKLPAILIALFILTRMYSYCCTYRYRIQLEEAESNMVVERTLGWGCFQETYPLRFSKDMGYGQWEINTKRNGEDYWRDVPLDWRLQWGYEEEWDDHDGEYGF